MIELLTAVGTVGAVVAALLIALRDARWRNADRGGRALAVALVVHAGVKEWERRSRGVLQHLKDDRSSVGPFLMDRTDARNPMLIPEEVASSRHRLVDLGSAARPLVHAILAVEEARVLVPNWLVLEENRGYGDVPAARRFEAVVATLHRELRQARQEIEAILGIQPS